MKVVGVFHKLVGPKMGDEVLTSAFIAISKEFE